MSRIGGIIISYLALYRKYRPSTFEELVGQEYIVKTLKNSIKANKINHAYLFSGPRGTGKTSIAKLYAKLINCKNKNDTNPCMACDVCLDTAYPDIIEIDAASNNGVDEVREIKNSCMIMPVNGLYKIYIIDEVHMLTNQAFNALLKTLEEPPKHVIFILATTEPHKIPLTIISRCQRYDFKKISNKDIVKRLSEIVKLENINILDDALLEIARISDGGLRDAISLLDKLTSYNSDTIGIQEVSNLSNQITEKDIYNLLINIKEENYSEVFQTIDKLVENGKSMSLVIKNTADFLRNAVRAINAREYFQNTNMNADIYFEYIKKTSKEEIFKLINLLNKIVLENKDEETLRILFEINIIPTYLPEINISKPEEPREVTNIKQVQKEISLDTTDLDNEGLITKLEEIRVNNCLCGAEKNILNDIKKKFKDIIMIKTDEENMRILNILRDAVVQVASPEVVILTFKTNAMKMLLNSELPYFEEFIKKTMDLDIKLIAITQNEWNNIKCEYLECIKQNIKYEMILETPIIEKIVFTKDKEENNNEHASDNATSEENANRNS